MLENSLLQAIVKTARKTGRILIRPMETEKWNRPDSYGAETLIPRANGYFDVEGHSSTDIEVSYEVSLDFNFFKHVCGWIWEIATVRDFEFALATNPFRKHWTNWAFTVDSFSSYSWEIAEKIVSISNPGLSRKKYSQYRTRVEEARKGVTYQQIDDYLANNGYWMTRSGFYVNREDPTCMVVNDQRYPFSMKDGWSNVGITMLINIWFHDLAEVGDFIIVRENKRA